MKIERRYCARKGRLDGDKQHVVGRVPCAECVWGRVRQSLCDQPMYFVITLFFSYLNKNTTYTLLDCYDFEGYILEG